MVFKNTLRYRFSNAINYVSKFSKIIKCENLSTPISFSRIGMGKFKTAKIIFQ